MHTTLRRTQGIGAAKELSYFTLILRVMTSDYITNQPTIWSMLSIGLFVSG